MVQVCPPKVLSCKVGSIGLILRCKGSNDKLADHFAPKVEEHIQCSGIICLHASLSTCCLGLNGHGDIHAWGQTIPSYRKYLIKRMPQHTEFPYVEPNLVEYFQENL